MEDERIKDHFPDVLEGGKLPPREYFFNILNTFDNVYLS
jgi:hypothetical protein